MTDTLRDRIAAAARTVQLRLGPNAIAMAQRGEPIILNMGEAAALADAVLPLAAAETGAVLRIVTDWCIEANDVGGVDAGDLAYRLEQAGYPLPDDDEDPTAPATEEQP